MNEEKVVKDRNDENRNTKNEKRLSIGMPLLILLVVLGFSFGFLSVQIHYLKSEVRKVDPNIPDGVVTVHVQDKTKDTKDSKMQYIIGIAPTDIPWDDKAGDVGFFNVTKTEYDAFEIGKTYQIEYRKSINIFDDFPNIISAELVTTDDQM